MVGMLYQALQSTYSDILCQSSKPRGQGPQWAKFAKKVNKPPLWVIAIHFKLNGLDASILPPDFCIFEFLKQI